MNSFFFRIDEIFFFQLFFAKKSLSFLEAQGDLFISRNILDIFFSTKI